MYDDTQEIATGTDNNGPVKTESSHLQPQHQAYLRNRAVADDVADERGYYTCDDPQELRALKFSPDQSKLTPALVIPTYTVDGIPQVKLMRPDNPRTLPDGTKPKFEFLRGCGNSIDVPPRSLPHIGNPKVELWITEAVPKADALVSLGLCAIDLIGCWNWVGTNSFGGKTVIPDWRMIACNDRSIVIVYDSDMVLKPSVREGALQLAAELKRRGAKVQFCLLPDAGDGLKIGVDDYLATGKTEADLRALIAPSVPAEWGIWPGPDDPLKVAERYMERHLWGDTYTLAYWRGDFHRWNGCHWDTWDVDEIDGELWRILGDVKHQIPDKKNEGQFITVPWQPNKTAVSNVLAGTKALAIESVSSRTEPPVWTKNAPQTPGPFIAMRNGVLDISTKTLIPNTPEFFNTMSIPFEYDPNAPEPTVWLKFLDSLWDDQPELIDTLQEIFGYIISGDTRLQKIFYIKGEPRSGKGTIERILEKLVGDDMRCAPTTASLSENFGLQNIIGKSLMVLTDARLSGGNTSEVVERLLTLSGGDPVSIARKYQKDWSGMATVRILILSNDLLNLADTSAAIVSRFIILPTYRSFLGKEDPDLDDKLAAECAGIFNWALVGLDRLRARGRFLEPDASRELCAVMADNASPIKTFLEEKCELDPTAKMNKKELYSLWKTWSEIQGNQPGSINGFTRRLHSAGIPGFRSENVKLFATDVCGGPPKRVPAYQGIRPKGSKPSGASEQTTRALPYDDDPNAPF